MVDYGAKVSKAGADVLTVAVADQIFNTEKNTMKIAIEGTTSSANLGDGGTSTIAHGMSDAPGFLVFWERANSGTWYALYASDGTVNVAAYSDTTNLIITKNGSGTHAMIFHYLILADVGN